MKAKMMMLVLVVLTLSGLVLGATTITEDSINTSQLVFGSGTNGYGNYSSTRLLSSSAYTSVTVCDSGCTYETINEAIQTIPLYLTHRYIITVKSPYTAKEDVYFPPFIAGSDMDSGDLGAMAVILQGNSSNLNEIEINSVHALGSIGTALPTIRYFKVTGIDPNNNEDVGITINGARNAYLQSLNFSGSTADYGVQAYGGGVSVAQIDLGNNLTYGFASKHTGYFHFENHILASGNVSNTGNVIGNVSGYVYMNMGGVSYGVTNNEATGVLGLAYASRAPISIYPAGNGEDGVLYGINELYNTTYGLNVCRTTGCNMTSSFRIPSGEYIYFNATGTAVALLQSTTASGGKQLNVYAPSSTYFQSGNIFLVATNSLEFDSGGAGRSEIYSPGSASNVTMFVNGGVNNVNITSSGLVVKNIKAVSYAYGVCDTSNAGMIVYNATAFKHYGCNSTNWNVLY